MRWKENTGLGIYAFLFMLLPFLLTFCVSEAETRRAWQDCGNVSHEVCRHEMDPRGCEYEMYKVCINEGAAPPDAR